MIKKNVKGNKESLVANPSETGKQPYDQTHPIAKMKFFVVIVNHSHSKEIVRIMNQHEVGLSFITLGRGTGTREIYEILGLSDVRKDIVFSVVKSCNLEAVKAKVAAYFSQAKETKGIAFAVEISSVIGVSIYRYLSNTRTRGA
ncbi:MAG: hypothetical protein WC344_02395 [Bacilli bacterium]|jgi:hypothetical protein